MNNLQYGRLKPFLKRTSYKSKIFIYLLAEGEIPLAISKMSKEDCFAKLKSYNVPEEIKLCFESLFVNLAGSGTELAFTYPNGRKYSVGDIESILMRAYGIAGLEYRGVRAFSAFITTGGKSG